MDICDSRVDFATENKIDYLCYYLSTENETIVRMET